MNGPRHAQRLGTVSLDTIRPQPMRWLVPGYIPTGKLTLIAGNGGEGKTSVTLNMAADLTTGRPCFGLRYEPPAPADVLLIACEDDVEDTVVPRLSAAGADLKRVHALPAAHTFDLGCADRLSAELTAAPAIKLVVIDPVGSFLPVGINENRDAEARSVLRPLSEVAALHGVAILLVKHLNKPGAGGRAVNRVGGSVAWVNAVRVAFVVASDSATPDRKLFIPAKANVLPPGTTGFAFRVEALPTMEAARIVGAMTHLDDGGRAALAQQLIRVAWGGPVTTTADEALAEPVRLTRVEECALWVVRFLGEHSWPDRELTGNAEQAGFTADNVKDAKAKLRTAEPRLCSKARGKGGTWWNWIGSREKPNPDRPEVPDTPKTPDTPQTPDTRSVPLPSPSSSEREDEGERRKEEAEEGQVWGVSGVWGVTGVLETRCPIPNV